MTRFKCAVCGKVTTGRLPGGRRGAADGTARFPRRHMTDGAPCAGNTIEAVWIEAAEPRPTKREKGGDVPARKQGTSPRR